MSTTLFLTRRPAFPAAATVLLAVTVFTLTSLAPSGARAEADDDDPVAKITQLNRDAIGAYQARKFEDARKLLKQALDLAAASGLEQHPIKARTHIHMGIVIIGGFKQRDVGLKQFKKAIEIQPDIQLTKGLGTPDLQTAFEQAASELKGGGAAAAGGGGAPTEAAAPAPAVDVSSGGLVHETVSEGKQGSAISISVGVPSELKFDKLVLAYRPEGTTAFLGRQMKQVTDGTYAAEIPTTATLGRSVAYYIEAQDKEGGSLAARGSADSPLTISLSGGSPPAAVARREEGEEEEDGDDEEGGPSRIFVGIMGGSGFGWASGNGDTNADTMIRPAGLAGASLAQFSPEVGYWFRPNFMVSLQGRFQYISGTTDVHRPTVADPNRVYHAANYAAAIFAKATWRFRSGGLRPFFSLALGAGQIRHQVTFKTLKDCGASRQETCVDTIAGGPILAGPGGGIMYALNDRFGFVLQANTQLAFPDFTFNVDGNVGVAMSF